MTASGGEDESGVFLRDWASGMTSDFGENGILEKTFEVLKTPHKICVDVGAGHLERRSNVYPLWKKQDWKAYLVEGDAQRCSAIRKALQQLDASGRERVRVVQTTVEPRGENRLDAALSALDLPRDFELLDIDVDGLDYHLWKRLDRYRPLTVMIEYNSSVPPHMELLGKEEGNRVGASLRALLNLGQEKGYDLAAITPVNALFVRGDRSGPFEAVNDLDRLWDPEFHGRFLRYAMGTFEGKLFFSGEPIMHDDFEFATPEEAGLVQEDEVFFARPRPEPSDVVRYFFGYPLEYLANHWTVLRKLRARFDELSLPSFLEPLMRRFRTEDSEGSG